jgi:hypothetical protein
MLCTLSRWMISRAEDTGKKLPRIVERHIGRCGACGEYARSSASISSGLRRERSAWLAEVPEFPSGLGLEKGQPRTGSRTVETARPGARRPWLALRPLPVAAAVIVLVAAGLVLFRVALREPAPSAEDRIAARAAIKELALAPEELQGVIGEAESSLVRERQILEKSIASAVDYVQARLNIRVERKEPPKTL